MPCVGVCHTTRFIAILFVQYPDIKHPVVNDQEEYRPLDEWPIQSLNAFLDKCRLVIQVFQREEIACCDKEKGHVEFKDEMAEPARCLSMGYHHQDNGDAFADRYIRNTIHEMLRKNVSGVGGTSALRMQR